MNTLAAPNASSFLVVSEQKAFRKWLPYIFIDIYWKKKYFFIWIHGHTSLFLIHTNHFGHQNFF